jgi:hypothetical protein
LFIQKTVYSRVITKLVKTSVILSGYLEQAAEGKKKCSTSSVAVRGTNTYEV